MDDKLELQSRLELFSICTRLMTDQDRINDDFLVFLLLYAVVRETFQKG